MSAAWASIAAAIPAIAAVRTAGDAFATIREAARAASATCRITCAR
jgi:hypothetical protein